MNKIIAIAAIIAVIYSFAIGYRLGNSRLPNYYNEYIENRDERDILSDIIRKSMDENDSCVINNAKFYLNIVSKDTIDLNNWSYCY